MIADRAEPADRWWPLAGAAVVLAVLPMAFLGPGTDLDVGAVLRSGRSIVEDRTYVASRAPGAPVHETAVGLLDAVGGPVAANLGSLVAAVALVAGLVVLLAHEGVRPRRRVGLAVAVVVSNPFFLVAATSTVDFLWALALLAWAAVVLRTRPGWGGAVGAGALAGLAIGSRASTAVLVVALVVAHALDRSASGERSEHPQEDEVRPVGGALAASAVAAVVGVLLFVPSFRASGSSLAFASNEVPTSSLPVQIGRFLVKDLYFFGPFAAVVLVLALPALIRVVGRWSTDFLVRFGLLLVVGSQLLFLRYPWKLGHLLPTLVGLALLLARALGDRPRILAALVVAQLLYGVASITLIHPDTPNAATGGELTFSPRWGALVTDVRCRADDPDAWTAEGTEGFDRVQAVWDCALPWRSDP